MKLWRNLTHRRYKVHTYSKLDMLSHSMGVLPLVASAIGMPCSKEASVRNARIDVVDVDGKQRRRRQWRRGEVVAVRRAGRQSGHWPCTVHASGQAVAAATGQAHHEEARLRSLARPTEPGRVHAGDKVRESSKSSRRSATVFARVVATSPFQGDV